MRCILIITLAVWALSGCATRAIEVQTDGDGVYYAESPPDFIYADYPLAYSYFSPNFYPYYFSVWYSPLIVQHYRGYHLPIFACSSYRGPAYAYFSNTGRPAGFEEFYRGARKPARPLRALDRRTIDALPAHLATLESARYRSRAELRREPYLPARAVSRSSASSRQASRPAVKTHRRAVASAPSPSRTRVSVPRSSERER